MRTLLLLPFLALFVACSNGATSTGSLPVASYQQIQNFDGGSVPTTDAGDGFDMVGVVSARLTICSWSSPSASDGGFAGLLNGGTILFEQRPVSVGAWTHVKENDKTINVTDSACQTWGDLTNRVSGSRFKPVVSGAATNDGGLWFQVTMDYVQE